MRKVIALTVLLLIAVSIFLRPKNTAPQSTGSSPPAASVKKVDRAHLSRQPAQQKKSSTTDLKNDLLNKLKFLQTCYQSQTCAFPKTDPRSYEHSLGQEIKSTLAQFNSQFSGSTELKSLAIEFIKSGDGFVQEEALKIFSSLPTSAESLTAITEGLLLSPDATLLQQALPELQRYLGTAMEPQVHGFLSTTISTGAHFSSQTVSENILPFINSQSYATYQKALRAMTPGAKATSNLSWALREYQRLQTGA